MRSSLALLTSVAIGAVMGMTAGQAPLALAADPVLAGVGSCAASSCHGALHAMTSSGRGSPRPGSEFSVWVSFDDHHEAYATLFSEESKRIASALYHDTKANEAETCLKCHATAAGYDATGAPHAIVDGVSCESCHGPSGGGGGASSWLAAHTSRTWKAMSAGEKAAMGFRDMRNLVERARVCAECHVGVHGREVTHEMIAAGHPRLAFELTAYLAEMPRHWIEQPPPNLDKQLARNWTDTFEARAWMIGQIMSAEAAVRMLEDQVPKWDTSGPEFSQFGCFSCHHDLRPEPWREGDPRASRRVGQPVWGSWYLPLVRRMATFDDQPPTLNPHQMAKIVEDLGAVAARIENWQMPPDRQEMTLMLQTLAAALREWAMSCEKFDFQQAHVASLAELLTQRNEFAATDWDSAAQVYLGLVALHEAGSTRPTRQQLTTLREVLRFGDDYDSPHEFQTNEFLRAIGLQ